MISIRMLFAAIEKSRVRSYWPVWAICVLFLAIDLTARFVNISPQEGDNYRPFFQGESSILVLSSDKLEDYLSKLPKQVEEYYTSPIDSELTEPMTNPGAWEASDYSYQLLATFRSTNAFAVVSRLSLESKGRDILELQVGDSISNFSVSKVTHKGIVLAGPDGERVALRLFKPSFAELVDGVSASGP